MLMRALFSESARLEPNTSSHVRHHYTLDLPDWREGTRVSPSRLPVFLQLCPGSPEPLLAVIASGLGTPHDSRKQQSHFTSWYTVVHSGVDDACFTPRRARIFHKGATMFCFRVVLLRTKLCSCASDTKKADLYFNGMSDVQIGLVFGLDGEEHIRIHWTKCP